MDTLREQVMINQFVLAAGCAREQAKQLLQAAHWQFETALSIFFQEAAIPPCAQGPGTHFGQNLQIRCCITLKESYDPDNDEAAPKDASPNTSLPTRNICTLSVAVLRSVALFLRHSGPYSGVTPTEHTAVAKGLKSKFIITPCNTPATPPNFPDALLAFSKMSAGDKTPSGMSPSQNGLHQNSMQMGMAAQHHGGRCSVTGNTQQQTQSQQLGLGEPQR